MPDPRPADAFRDLRTQLLSRTSSDGTVILVAPVRRGSGGSFVATNLAAAIAMDESRTAILVDGNFRSPVLHERLGVAMDQGGLVDYIEGRVAPLAGVVYATPIPRLLLVPAGAQREASGDLLSSGRMRHAIEALRTSGERVTVVLDAAAVASAPDARIASQFADLSVLVAGYGRDTATAVADASAVFDPARLAGVVFNKVP
jgi:Mrp family chromosome partitioning ATPase